MRSLRADRGPPPKEVGLARDRAPAGQARGWRM